MTRNFILTWGSRARDLRVAVDPVGLENWSNPLEMVRWVVGHAVSGRGRKYDDPRRTDEVTLMGVNGRWEGLLHGTPFIILDTLFEAPARPRTKFKEELYEAVFGQQPPVLQPAAPVQMQNVQWHHVGGHGGMGQQNIAQAAQQAQGGGWAYLPANPAPQQGNAWVGGGGDAGGAEHQQAPAQPAPVVRVIVDE